MGVLLLIVAVLALFWVAWTFGLQIFSDLFPQGFWPAWWENVQQNLGFHITTLLIGLLAMALFGVLKK